MKKNKRIRRNLIVDGERMWLTGNSEQDIIDKVVDIVRRKYVDVIYVPKSGTNEVITDAEESVPLLTFKENNANNKSSIYSITFEKYALNWLETYKMKALKPNTYETYKRKFHAHLIPAFGRKKLTEITTEDVQVFMNERSHLAKKTIRDIKALLGEIMKDALDEGLIKKDPTVSRRLRIPSDKEHKRDALPIDQFRDILNKSTKLKKNDMLLMYMIMLTGMRRGEVLGLKWGDIDFERGLIYIRRNVTHPNGNTPVIGTPKTKSGVRVIPLDSTLKKLLAPGDMDDFIFGSKHPITLRTYSNTWTRIKKSINLYGATAHILRHSYLTYVAGAGTDLKTLQSMAGHSTIGMTMNLYVHPLAENIQEAGEKLHEAVFEGMKCENKNI